MKLAIKLCSILFVGIVAILAVDAYLAVQSESEAILSDMRYETALLGHSMKNLVADVWNNSGEERALRLIEDANREENAVRIRLIWLEDVTDVRHRPQVALRKLGAVVRGEQASFHISDASNDGQLVTYVPVTLTGHGPSALELSESMARLNSHNRRTVSRALTVMAMLLASGGASVLVLGVTLVARPLGRLSAMVRRIGEGDLGIRLDLHTGDELSALADALNGMCQQLSESQDTARKEIEARIAAIEQLRHADRLATVGRLASGVAHEVGTPLNVIAARAKQIRVDGLLQTEIKKNAAIIGKQSERIARIIRQLLAFARPSRQHWLPLDLAKTARETTSLLKPLAEKHSVLLRTIVCHNPPFVLADEAQIEQVIANLVVNAIQAMQRGGNVEVRVFLNRACRPGVEDAREMIYACVSVRDEGSGIAEKDLSSIFDPFFTTKDVGEGTGLGLSLAHEIVREHGGWIAVASQLGKGSRFTIHLPLASNDAPDIEQNAPLFTHAIGPGHLSQKAS